MATSGLVSAIHCLDFSNPLKTRFQYGSSVRLLSIAAPIAGTCEDATPAMILATFRPRFLARSEFGFGFLRFCLDLGLGFLTLGLLALFGLAGQLEACPAAIAFDRAAARQHHLGVVFLGRAGHDCSDV